jgi:hypothetical protein
MFLRQNSVAFFAYSAVISLIVLDTILVSDTNRHIFLKLAISKYFFPQYILSCQQNNSKNASFGVRIPIYMQS